MHLAPATEMSWPSCRQSFKLRGVVVNSWQTYWLYTAIWVSAWIVGNRIDSNTKAIEAQTAAIVAGQECVP